MKKFIRILSVVLCALTVISSANLMCFAADEKLPETAAASDESVSKQADEQNVNTKKAVSENDDGAARALVSDKSEYEERLHTNVEIALENMSGIVALPLMVTGVSITWLFLAAFLLPVTLPLSAVAGAGMSVLGVLELIASPVASLFVEYPEVKI